MRILVAEDDPVSKRVMEASLNKLGHETISAVNGREAIEKLNKEDLFDLIISDIMMPEMDGLGLLKFIKNNRKFLNIPVLLTTALNDMNTVRTALNLGVAGYLVKPITKDILKVKLDEITDSIRLPILIVDDEEIILTLLKRVIENEGYRTVTATNGEQALEIIFEKKLNLVISDIKMPNMSGIELLKEIKGAFTTTKVILMTGFSLELDKDKALAEGADDYISKPFKNTEIIQKIRKLYPISK